jgi:hypothetical protein
MSVSIDIIAADSQHAMSEPHSSLEEGGVVVVGMANINDLSSALELSTGKAGGGAAEGGAFDPAVVKLLAMSFVLEHSGNSPGIGEGRVLDAETAFLHNERVALNAGLVGHGAIMSSFASLVRLLTQPSMGAGTNSTLDASYAEGSASVSEDPFRALALSSIRDLLSELLDVGDCQHFVVCFEILRRCSLLDGIAGPGKPKGASNSNTPATTSEPPLSATTAQPTNAAAAVNSQSTMGSVRPEDRKTFCLEPTPTSQLLSDLRVREAYLSYIDQSHHRLHEIVQDTGCTAPLF